MNFKKIFGAGFLAALIGCEDIVTNLHSHTDSNNVVYAGEVTTNNWTDRNGKSHASIQGSDKQGNKHIIHRWQDPGNLNHQSDHWIDNNDVTHTCHRWVDKNGAIHEAVHITKSDGSSSSGHFFKDKEGRVKKID